jgi:uncharacterized membrane protein
VILGSARNAANQWEAVRWVGGSTTDLGFVNGGTLSHGYGLNSDGSVAVGHALDGAASRYAPLVWTTGGATALTDVRGSFSWANAISTDGSTIVGTTGGAGGGRVAAYWDRATGSLHDLGDLPGGSVAGAGWDVSGDGSVMVGRGHSGAGYQPFIWTDRVVAVVEDAGGQHGIGAADAARRRPGARGCRHRPRRSPAPAPRR